MKKSLLIGALSAAALLVGGTVAAFVVADNADPKTASIQIGTIEGNVVTLDWATPAKDPLHDITGLSAEAPKSLGRVSVKATGKDVGGVAVSETNPYTGYLELSLDNAYGGKLSVYAKKVGEEAALTPLEGTGANLVRYSVTVGASAVEYEIFAQLAEIETNADVAAVSGKTATVTVNWNDSASQVGYSATVNGALIGLTDVKEEGNTNHAVFKVTLDADDVIAIKYDGNALPFGQWDDVNKKDVVKGYVFTATKAGEHTFYVNANDFIYVGEPEEIVVPTYLTGEQTLYFSNSQNWNNVYLYAYGDNGENVAWPGVKLETVVGKNEYSQDIYSFEINLDNYNLIIFNNGEGAQTVNIDTKTIEKNGFYAGELKEGKYTFGTFTHEVAPVADPTSGN